MAEYEQYLKESGHPQRIVELAKEIHTLRQMLWISHGHSGIYGDDGEMQCSECQRQYGFWDWKRTPIEEISSKIFSFNIKNLTI
jgi:hypothetical protein